jgi:hypothetical protein
MLMVSPDTVTVPCQVNVKFVVPNTKVEVPLILPFGSTCKELTALPTAPFVPVIELLTLPFASIDTVRVPPTSLSLLLYNTVPDQTPVPDPWKANGAGLVVVDVDADVVGDVITLVGVDVGTVEGAITAKSTGALFTPDSAAVMVAVPVATPVAKPVESIVATPVLLLAQVTSAVMSTDVPSKYVPVAMNAWVEPTATLCKVGSTTIEDSFDFGVDASVFVVVVIELEIDVDAEEDFGEQVQAGIIMVNATINPITRQRPANRS